MVRLIRVSVVAVTVAVTEGIRRAASVTNIPVAGVEVTSAYVVEPPTTMFMSTPAIPAAMEDITVVSGFVYLTPLATMVVLTPSVMLVGSTLNGSVNTVVDATRCMAVGPCCRPA